MLFISAEDSSWATLSIADPPLTSFADDESFTYIKDASGNITKVAIYQAPNDTVPFFETTKDTRFELFTPINPTEPQLLSLDDPTSIEKSNFNAAYPLRVFIHGW